MTVRHYLFGSCVVASLVGAGWCGCELVKVLKEGHTGASVKYSATGRMAYDLVLDQSKSMMSTALVIGGVAWGLLIFKKDEQKIVIGLNIEFMMFAMCNVLLLLAMVCHLRFTAEVAEAVSTLARTGGGDLGERIPDLYKLNFERLFWAEVIVLVSAGWNVACAFFCCNQLRT